MAGLERDARAMMIEMCAREVCAYQEDVAEEADTGSDPCLLQTRKRQRRSAIASLEEALNKDVPE